MSTPPAFETVDRRTFLQAMRAVANSVTVVTTQNEAERQGATVSAFCSVSADPPTLLVCLHRESRISETVQANGTFCVNVLPKTQAEVSDRFAGRHDDVVADRFDGIELASAGTTAPALAGSTCFECVVHDSMVSGTHLIIVGRVTAVSSGHPEPLLYFDGEYHHLAIHAESAVE